MVRIDNIIIIRRKHKAIEESTYRFVWLINGMLVTSMNKEREKIGGFSTYKLALEDSTSRQTTSPDIVLHTSENDKNIILISYFSDVSWRMSEKTS